MVLCNEDERAKALLGAKAQAPVASKAVIPAANFMVDIWIVKIVQGESVWTSGRGRFCGRDAKLNFTFDNVIRADFRRLHVFP